MDGDYEIDDLGKLMAVATANAYSIEVRRVEPALGRHWVPAALPEDALLLLSAACIAAVSCWPEGVALLCFVQT